MEVLTWDAPDKLHGSLRLKRRFAGTDRGPRDISR